MAWNLGAESGSGKSSVSVVEGNIEVFLFSESPTTIKFLTEDISVEQVMSERNVPREQATEILNTQIVRERWIQPQSYWEHSIPSIPGIRFYSTVPCSGSRNGCVLCAQNQQKKDSGISENKLLPFPVRKRFLVPAYFYELGRVLFVRGNEDFFKDVGAYLNKNGSDSSFDIWKTGKGFETKYKAIYGGKADPIDPAATKGLVTPSKVDIFLDSQEIERRIAVRSVQAGSVQEHQPDRKTQTEGQERAIESKENDASSFFIPFGTHKGHTLSQILDLGDMKYIEFLRDNGSGVVKTKASEFLVSL